MRPADTPDLSFGWQNYSTSHNPFRHGKSYQALDIQESDEPAVEEEPCASCREAGSTVRLFRVGADDIARECWFFCAGCFRAMVRSGEVVLHAE